MKNANTVKQTIVSAIDKAKNTATIGKYKSGFCGTIPIKVINKHLPFHRRILEIGTSALTN